MIIVLERIGFGGRPSNFALTSRTFKRTVVY
ncbi:hypothetical protein SMWOGL2_42670 [Sporomusa malonica]